MERDQNFQNVSRPTGSVKVKQLSLFGPRALDGCLSQTLSNKTNVSSTLASLTRSQISMESQSCGQSMRTSCPQRSKTSGSAPSKIKRSTLQAVCKTYLQLLLLDSFVIDLGHLKSIVHM